jgi:hypothetical protein
MSMERLAVPTFEPCPNCCGGMVMRNGKQERCICWIKWWEAVRAALTGAEKR